MLKIHEMGQDEVGSHLSITNHLVHHLIDLKKHPNTLCLPKTLQPLLVCNLVGFSEHYILLIPWYRVLHEHVISCSAC